MRYVCGIYAETNFAEYGPADNSQIFQDLFSNPPPCDKAKVKECIARSFVYYMYRVKDGNQRASHVSVLYKCNTLHTWR